MPKVEFTDDGITQEVEEGSNFIKAVEASGANIPFGCQNGECGTCMCTVLEGMENLNEIGDKEKQTLEGFGGEEGDRLGCQLTIKGDIKIKRKE